MQKLIIIRGPSGAGKSTIAQKLVERIETPTLLVSEDTLRKNFSDWRQPNQDTSKDLAIQTVLFGLEHGYGVIYEGILNIKTYGDRFDKLLKLHPQGNYVFYLDVSFDETKRRHNSRPEKSEFTHEDMARWRDYASPMSVQNETIISESSSVNKTIETILKGAKYTN